MVENTCPILRVSNLDASLSYYTKSLGFSVDWSDGMAASVGRDSGHIMLIEGGQGRFGAYVWMGVNDVSVLHQEYLASGAIIRHAPLNHPWAKEMKVEDPDGNVLRIGSGPDDDSAYDDFVE